MAWSKLPWFPTCKGLHYRQLLETSGAKGHLKCEHSRLPKQGNEMSLVIKNQNKTKNQPTNQSLDCTFQLWEADGPIWNLAPLRSMQRGT